MEFIHFIYFNWGHKNKKSSSSINEEIPLT